MLPALSPLASAAESSDTQYFGSRAVSEAALIGIFYDLKQDQKGATKRVRYEDVICEFLNKGWDETVLNQFFRAAQPLYTTQIFIPYIKAENAPRAFGVEKTVKPSNWVIHYKGQVASLTGGTFRFVGLSDDLLAVAVNSRTVLMAPHPNFKFQIDWQPTEGPPTSGPNGPIKFGTWFTVKKDDVIDLDILIGECPGGGFGAWLQIEEKGVTYAESETKHTRFPVFQLVPQTLDPGIFKWGGVPFYSSPGPLWKGIQ